MSDAKPLIKTQIEIPQSVLEYTLQFTTSVFNFGEERSRIITAVLQALQPWGFSIEGVEIKFRSEKLSEHATIFRRTNPALPTLSLALFFDKIFISAGNLDWDGAEKFISAVEAGVGKILEIVNVRAKAHIVALGMHVQLKDRSMADVGSPLLSPRALNLLDSDLICPGIIIKREKCTVIVEASLAYANSFFVRLFREHQPDATLRDMASALRKDEEQLFEVLGLEGAL